VGPGSGRGVSGVDRDGELKPAGMGNGELAPAGMETEQG